MRLSIDGRLPAPDDGAAGIKLQILEAVKPDIPRRLLRQLQAHIAAPKLIIALRLETQ